MKNYYLLFVGMALLSFTTISAQFTNKKKDFDKYEGLFDFYYDESTDKMYLEVDELNKEFL